MCYRRLLKLLLQMLTRHFGYIFIKDVEKALSGVSDKLCPLLPACDYQWSANFVFRKTIAVFRRT